MILKNCTPGAGLPPLRGNIHVYYHNIQSFSESTWSIKAKLHVEHPKEVGTKVYINGPDHMTKMAAMAINRKKISFSRTIRSMILNLGMKHRERSST